MDLRQSSKMTIYEAAHHAAAAAIDAHGPDYPPAAVAYDFIRQVEADDPGFYGDIPEIRPNSLTWYAFEQTYLDECRSRLAPGGPTC